MRGKEIILTSLYFIFVLISLYFIGVSNEIAVVVVIVFQHIILALLYYLSVLPIKKQNYSVYVLIFLFTLGDAFFAYHDLFFFSVVFYMILYLYLLFYTYNKELKGIGFFKIFTFSIPFIFSYSILVVLLETWEEPILLFFLIIAMLVACGLSSVVLLSYAYNKSLKNTYLFFGVYTLQFVNFLALVFHFDGKSKLFNLIVLFMGYLSELFIVKSFIFSDKENDVKKTDYSPTNKV